MPLSEKQINAICKLDRETQLEIMNICSEELGVVTPSEYMKIMGGSRTSIFDGMKQGRINHFKICDKYFPCINLNLHQ